MKNIKKLLALAFRFFGLFVVVACSGGSGVKALIKYTSTTNKIDLEITFDENSNLSSKAAVPSVKQYVLDADGNEEFSASHDVKFNEGTYENAKCSVTGLKEETTYRFYLYITFNGNQEKITYVDAKTSSLGADEDHPILISTTDEFLDMTNNPDAFYKLTADIDFDGETVTSLFSSSNKFTGNFDGNEKTIKNAVLTSTTYSGLFGYTEDATIKNVKLNNISASYTSSSSSTTGFGSLVGIGVNTKILNVEVNTVAFTFSASSSSGDYSIGGLAGILDGSTVYNTHVSNANIDITQARGKVSSGLLIGKALGEPATLSDYNNLDSVLAYKTSAEGTLKAYMYYTSSEGFTFLGGLIGNDGAAGLVASSYADADIIVTKYVSSSTSSAIDNYTLAVGGLIGGNNSGNGISIKDTMALASINVYAQKEIPSTDQEVIDLASVQMTKKNVYVGGIIGLVNLYSGTLSNSKFYGKHTDNGDDINVLCAEYCQTQSGKVTEDNFDNGKFFVKNDLDEYVLPTTYDKNATYYYTEKNVSPIIGAVLDTDVDTTSLSSLLFADRTTQTDQSIVEGFIAAYIDQLS